MLEARGGGAGPQIWLLFLLGALALVTHAIEHTAAEGTTAHTWVALLSGGCTVGTAAKALYACFTLAGSSSGEGGWGNTYK